MPRKASTEKLSIDALAQHMTAELQILNQSADHARDMLMNKVNFFLILVTAIGSGLILMSTVDNLQNLVPMLSLVVIFILIVMGINTLRQGLDLSASAVTFYRRAGRIRRWYMEQTPTIKPYLPFESGADNLPRMSSNFINLRGAESILLLTNGSLCGILIGFIGYFLMNSIPSLSTPINIEIALGLGLIIVWLAWVLQVNYIRRFMKNWEERQEKLKLIHFPEELISEAEFEKMLKK